MYAQTNRNALMKPANIKNPTPATPKGRGKWMTQALTNHSTARGFFEPVMQIFNPNWQAQGFRAQVVETRKESKLVFTLVLRPQKKWPTFTAGQYIEIQVEINGVRYTRIFSLSSSPSQHAKSGLIELTIRQQTQGKVTPWLLEQLPTGAAVNISSAKGDFVLPNNNQPLLFIAGGSGITPFRSFLHQLANQFKDQDVHLIYYNQSTEPLFASEWLQLAEHMPHLQVSLIDTDIDGLINTTQLKQLCPDFSDRLAYICGPHGLITASRDILLELGVQDTDIRHELFGPKPITKLTQKLDGEVTFSRTQTQITSFADQPKTLLELAEASQTNPTSGCRMGVCHQCKCRKQQGVVFNTLTETYSDTGAEDIQLCVSVAVGDVTLEL